MEKETAGGRPPPVAAVPTNIAYSVEKGSPFPGQDAWKWEIKEDACKCAPMQCPNEGEEVGSHSSVAVGCANEICIRLLLADKYPARNVRHRVGEGLQRLEFRMIMLRS